MSFSVKSSGTNTAKHLCRRQQSSHLGTANECKHSSVVVPLHNDSHCLLQSDKMVLLKQKLKEVRENLNLGH